MLTSLDFLHHSPISPSKHCEAVKEPINTSFCSHIHTNPTGFSMSFFHSLYSFSRISQQIFYRFTRKWIIFWETNQPTRTGNQPNESLAVERSKIGEIFSWGIVTFQQHGSNYIPGIWKYKQSMSFFPLFLFNILNYSFAYLSMRPFAFFSPLLLSQNSPPFSLKKKEGRIHFWFLSFNSHLPTHHSFL